MSKYEVLYILNGEEYYTYNGYRFGIVFGYRPLIYTGRDWSGTDGELLEEVNKLIRQYDMINNMMKQFSGGKMSKKAMKRMKIPFNMI